MKHSYGILLYRLNSAGEVEVFLGHANSPRYWKRNPKKIWGIPKGRADKGEKGLETAKREFLEEVGFQAPNIEYVKLSKYLTPHKKTKRITIYVGDATGLKVSYNGSLLHVFKKKNGKKITYLEMDDAKWFTREKALKRIMWGQRGALKSFLNKLEKGTINSKKGNKQNG